MSGAGLASGSMPKFWLARNPLQDDMKFIYRTLEKTGIRLPVINMGTDNTNNPELVRAALDKGVKLLATSEAYQNGNNETMARVYWDNERTKPINVTVALKWVVQNENIHTTVPDCSTYDHLDQDLAIMANPELTEEEEQDLTPPSGDSSSGLYCLQCNQCISQCPEALDIPTIMRSYLYAYGYKNLEYARRTLGSTGFRSFPCNDCSSCNVNCIMNFDVRSRILDIARVQDIPEDFIM